MVEHNPSLRPAKELSGLGLAAEIYDWRPGPSTKEEDRSAGKPVIKRILAGWGGGGGPEMDRAVEIEKPNAANRACRAAGAG